MSVTTEVIPSAPLFYLHLQMDLTTALRAACQDYETVYSHAVTRQQGGVDLVGHEHGEVEREISTDERS